LEMGLEIVKHITINQNVENVTMNWLVSSKKWRVRND
jgi:hypothetical protein